MKIPVVCGPDSKEKAVTVEEPHWHVAYDLGLPGSEVACLPAENGEHTKKCKELCDFYKFSGFSIENGKASFRKGEIKVDQVQWKPKKGVVSYVYDPAAIPKKFKFTDFTFRPRLNEWLRGELTERLNGTDEHIE